VYENATDNE